MTQYTDDIEVFVDILSRIGLPLVIIIFLGIVIWKLMPHINEWLKQMTDDRRRAATREGELGELIRHCTAVIENNTAVVKCFEKIQNDSVHALEKHQQESYAYLDRIEKAQKEQLKDHDRFHTDIAKIGVKVDTLV